MLHRQSLLTYQFIFCYSLHTAFFFHRLRNDSTAERTMSNTTISSLDTLPTEVLHRIFDFLKASVLIFNVRPVSSKLRSVVANYNRYKVDSQSVSTTQFQRICRLIPPENAIALIITGSSGQLSRLDLPSYTRLQYLSLLEMDESQLQESIFSSLNLQHAESVTLTIKKYRDEQVKQTQELLSWILTGLALRRVEINFMESRFPLDVSTKNDLVQHLTLHTVNDVNRLSILLELLPQLHTLILKRLSFSTLKLPLKCFPALKSLSIEEFNGPIDRLEPFFLWTPGLMYLKICGRGNTFDALRWEDFVQMNLTQLVSFEFSFFLYPGGTLTPEELIAIMEPFQSSFWLEQKKWLMTCSHAMRDCPSVHLYSSPMRPVEDLHPDSSIIDNGNTLTLYVDDAFLRFLDDRVRIELPSVGLPSSSLESDWSSSVLPSSQKSEIKTYSGEVSPSLDVHLVNDEYLPSRADRIRRSWIFSNEPPCLDRVERTMRKSASPFHVGLSSDVS